MYARKLKLYQQHGPQRMRVFGQAIGPSSVTDLNLSSNALSADAISDFLQGLGDVSQGHSLHRLVLDRSDSTTAAQN